MPDTHDDSPNCLNCGTPLGGQYCGHCGQRALSRFISLWALMREAFGDLFELDSRLWRTLIPLLTRPGKLTQDYLLGRRARYMPPFRMYLVLSLIFFAVAFFDPSDSLWLFEPPAETTETAEPQPAEGATEIDGDEGAAEPAEERCSDLEIEGIEQILVGLTPDKAQQICEQIVADDGRQLLRNLIDNVPVALIVLLPLMALVLKLLYPLSRRYYVEHLLFFVHIHAFFFFVLSLLILFGRLAAWVRAPSWLAEIISVVVAIYMPVYLFKAMRRVYAQGWLATFLKYMVLLIAYLFGFAITMMGALFIAVTSV